MPRTPHPYTRFSDEQFILRDQLALDRTRLAAERTMLAYERTAIVFLATGGTMFKFFPESDGLRFIAWIFLVGGITLATIGLVRFVRITLVLSNVGKSTVTEWPKA